MNKNRNLVIDFRVNHEHDHYINEKESRHTQPHQREKFATKPKRK